MADQKITDLAAAGALDGSELVEAVQGGVNVQTTTGGIAALAAAGSAHVIEEEGTPLATRTKLNFVGAGVTVTDDSGDDATVVTITSSNVGVQDLPVSAAGMWPRVTGGCSLVKPYEMTTSLVNLLGLEFTTASQMFCQFQLPAFPRRWDNGTLTVVLKWKPLSSGSGNVRWGVQAAAYSDDDALTGAFGTEVAATDAYIALDDIHFTSATAVITPSGSPTGSDWIHFQINRDPAHTDDTLNVTAILLGVIVRWTSNAATDA